MAIKTRLGRSIVGRLAITVCEKVQENAQALRDLERSIRGKSLHVWMEEDTAEKLKDCRPRKVG